MDDIAGELPDRTPDPLSVLAAAGDHDALESLRSRLSPGLARFLARHAGARTELVEELEQRAWTLAISAIHNRRYDPARAKFSTFLYAVAWKVWLRHAERQAVRSRILESASEELARRRLDPDADDPADAVALAELLDTVRGALRGDAGLTDEHRAILSAVSRGTTDRELARELGVAPSTAFARRNSALHALRSLLARRGFRGPERGGSTTEEHPGRAGSHDHD